MGTRTSEDLQAENAMLRQKLETLTWVTQTGAHYYASVDAVTNEPDDAALPETGNSAAHCLRKISDYHELDCRERLNTASYVNVFLEPEEVQVANLGMRINLADQTVYPQSYKMHNAVLNMVAQLWNCPKPPEFDDDTHAYPGAGTLGSTEACLLAGLCFKIRWRRWYGKYKGLDDKEARTVFPNLVISTLFQAAWEKLFRYMDVEPRFVAPSYKTFTVTAEAVKEQIDEKTIGVVCIMGNHYAGHYDPIWEVDAMLQELNAEKGWQVGIHVDGASGGFVAPFQDGLPAWDFRLPTVLSINGSGHKFGESVCGTGWVVWRQREGLSEHVAINVSYLGGSCDSYTLNFSRPAMGVYVQYYKFHRLGHKGYRAICDNRMANAKYLRDALKAIKHADGRPKFMMLDAGDRHCLPVVAACLNPELGLPYDDVDLQHHMLQHHWYVSAYQTGYHDPYDEQLKPLFKDMKAEQTMFRVVVKSNVTRCMVENLIDAMKTCLADLDSLGPGYTAVHMTKKKNQGKMNHPC